MKEEKREEKEERHKKEERRKRIEEYFRREEEINEYFYNTGKNPDKLNSSCDEFNYNEGMNLESFNTNFYETSDDTYNRNSKEMLEKMPHKILCNISDEYKRCIICLEDFKINDTVIYLPCLHFFHSNCITLWIEKKANCPLCKNIIK